VHHAVALATCSFAPSTAAVDATGPNPSHLYEVCF